MKKSMSLFLAALLACTGLSNVNIKTEAAGDPVRILFTGNLNDHLELFKSLNEENKTVQVGGYTFLSSAIEENSNENTVVLDAGNFSAGTMYGSLNTSDAPDLTLMSQMGYDAVTFGETDLVYGISNFGEMLSAAEEAPAMVSANISFGSGSAADALKAGWQNVEGSSYTILDAGSYKVGVFGLMPLNEAYANGAALQIADPVQAAVNASESLKKEGADLVICLYSGKDNYEEICAQAEIDVLIKADSAIAPDQYEKSGNTIIAQADQYGKTLGLLDIDPQSGSVKSYDHLAVNADAYPPNDDIRTAVADYRAKVQDQLLKRFGLTASTPAFKTTYSLTTYDRFGTAKRYAEAADLVTDAMIEAYVPSGSDEAKPVSIIMENMVTGTLVAGNVYANDLFALAYKGMGSDGIPGYNLVHVYMSGEDLRNLCELDLLLNADNPGQLLHFGRMRYEYSTNRPEGNRVVDVYTEEADGYYIAATDDRMYPVITTAEVLQAIETMQGKTEYDLPVGAYDESGKKVADYDVMTMRTDGGAAVKLWSAITSYMAHFDRGSDGVDVLPSNYKSARKQRTKVSAQSIIKLFKHAGKPTVDFYLKVIAIPVAVLIGLNILVWLLNLKKRKETDA